MSIKFKPVASVPDRTGGASGEGPYIPLFKACRENPGQWFQLQDRKHSSVTGAIRNGRIKGAAPGEFEAVSRNTKDTKGDIYVRYVGKNSGEPQS